jgi:two-component system response regulator (stage 0 sporulation protein F)
VDDDNNINTMLREALSDVGFNVLTNNSGLKGLETLRSGSQKVDVVLLDYRMPVVDGTQTLEFLNDQFPTVKAIGITGLDPAELPEEYRNKVERLLPKPISISDLVVAIHEVLGVSAEAETARQKSGWMKAAVWCLLFVICGYGLLRIYGLMMHTALTLK